MHFTLHSFWVTVELDRGRTTDIRITARSQWAAGWLYRQLHPEHHILLVRPAGWK